MIELKPAVPDDWEIIQAIALQTWPETFGDVMPKEQIDYMLNLIYNEQSVKKQMVNLSHNFILVLRNDVPIGFTSYELNYGHTSQLMIHKVYLLPQSQGLGIGKKIFEQLTEIGKANKNHSLRLKVFHRNDKAKQFYAKYGFIIVGNEITDIGNEYIILDNVMTKKIL